MHKTNKLQKRNFRTWKHLENSFPKRKKKTGKSLFNTSKLWLLPIALRDCKHNRVYELTQLFLSVNTAKVRVVKSFFVMANKNK